MIKSQILSNKFLSWSQLYKTDYYSDSLVKFDLRRSLRDLRSKFDNWSTEDVFFSKVVSSEFHGINLLHANYTKKFNMFGTLMKFSKKRHVSKKRAQGVNFLFWSNYFSFLLSRASYFIILALENGDFVQRAYRKFRFSGISYLYLSNYLTKGVPLSSEYFATTDLRVGSFLFYSFSYDKFIELLHFLYSENVLSDFSVTKVKFDTLYFSNIHSLFFFNMLGTNKLQLFKLLCVHLNNLLNMLAGILIKIIFIQNAYVIRNFLTLKFLLLKYVYVYTSWKRMS
jgi:hypothetical protein